MNHLNKIIPLAIALIISGCGDDTEESTRPSVTPTPNPISTASPIPNPSSTPAPMPSSTPTPTPLPQNSASGVWHYVEPLGRGFTKNSYIEISQNGDFTLYQCTLNDGWIPHPRVSGNYNGTELSIREDIYFTGRYNDEVYSLTYSEENPSSLRIGDYDDILFGISVEDDDGAINFTRATSLPSSCNESIVEIVSVTPDNVISNIETPVSVEFQYRNSSGIDLLLGILGTCSDDESEVSEAIIEPGIGSGTLSFSYSYPADDSSCNVAALLDSYQIFGMGFTIFRIRFFQDNVFIDVQ